VTGNFEDEDYLLHPRNKEHLHQTVNNLHLACFWFTGRNMDASGCAERIEYDLENKDLPAEHRVVMEEAVLHLRRALNTPGWEEWLDNSISVPFEVDPNDFPGTILAAWSDSYQGDPEVIDAHSLRMLRIANERAAEIYSLEEAGWYDKERKADTLDWEDAENKRGKKKNSKGSKTSRDTEAVSKVPTAIPQIMWKYMQENKKKKDGIDGKIDEAARNAERNLATIQQFGQPRPLPTSIMTRSRSAKINFVMYSIVHSAEDDKFVIFGDNIELGHLTEALDIHDITS
jgi:hypothetical protein